jgi:hypothetical protein
VLELADPEGEDEVPHASDGWNYLAKKSISDWLTRSASS